VTEVLAPLHDDLRLRDALAGGCQQALAEAYDTYAPAVYGLALRITNDRGTAEDIAQEVFVELWQRPERYDPRRARLRTWLCMIARRRAIDWLRRRGTQDHYLPMLAQPDTAPMDVAEDVLTASLLKQVRAAVNDLPVLYRQVIVLAYYDGLTYREVAKALDIPEGTAKTRLRAGLRRIGEKLTAAGIGSLHASLD
jgi:RNA polymerase sigma-70 factor (ECF subfamily)